MKDKKIIRLLLVLFSVIFITAILYIYVTHSGTIQYSKDFAISETDLVAGASGSMEVQMVASELPQDELSIIIGGDSMFDRSIRARGERDGYGHFFDNMKSFFEEADLVVVNLEGPITANKSKTLLDNGTYSSDLKFTFSTSTAKVLAEVGIDVVSLANNHTDNFGYNGYLETKKWLDMNGVNHFGSPWNSTSTEMVFEKNGIKVAFVGYHFFIPGLKNVIEDIKRLKGQGYFVIVMPHWGEEYFTHHLPKMEEIAREMIDAGADAIVGAHPHVIMDHQWIGGVPVFYSLGNLLFDQYFSPEVKKGNIIRINLKHGDLAPDSVSQSSKIKSIEIFDVYDSASGPIMFDLASSTVEVI